MCKSFIKFSQKKSPNNEFFTTCLWSNETETGQACLSNRLSWVRCSIGSITWSGPTDRSKNSFKTNRHAISDIRWFDFDDVVWQ